MYGPRLPFTDDWYFVPVITGEAPLTFSWLWAPHNEHRIVTAKLISVVLYRITGGDYRSLIFVNIFLLSFLSAATILTFRSVRGRTVYVDAFYPLFLMHLGQAAFFWGFELQFTLVTTLVCLISLVFVYSGPTLSPLASMAAGSLLILLPISGGNGLLYVPCVAVWMVIRATWHAKRRGSQADAPAPSRRAQIILLGSAGVAVAIAAVYFVGWNAAPSIYTASDIPQFTSTAVRVLTAAFGKASDKFWPLSAFASAIFLATSLTYAIFVGLDGRQLPAHRCRAIDVAAFMIAFIPQALAVGYSRGARGFVPMEHYSTLVLPTVYWSFIVWGVGRPRLVAKSAQVLTCVIMCVFWFRYVEIAVRDASEHFLGEHEIEQALKSGVKSDVITDSYINALFYLDVPFGRKIVKDGIDGFRKAGFARYGSEARADRP
jgi:hypothetical protein